MKKVKNVLQEIDWEKVAIRFGFYSMFTTFIGIVLMVNLPREIISEYFIWKWGFIGFFFSYMFISFFVSLYFENIIQEMRGEIQKELSLEQK